MRAWMTVALLLIALPTASALADRVGYGEVVDLSRETDAVRAEHHHDWSRSTLDARRRMISTTGNPFADGNDYAYLQLRDKATGTLLFHKPGPAFSYIWISPDSKYVVGISNIKYFNPYQLVVYGRSGDRLLERDITQLKLKGASESVSNWIYWYREPAPKIVIVENGTTATLSVESSRDGFHQFEFPATR